MIEVNLDQLAKLLRCSLPTARKLVEDYADMPVVERGGLGKQWRFDGEAVVAFLQTEREKEAAAQAEKNEALAQLTLPMVRKDDLGNAISLDDQLKAAKLRAVQRDELKESGFLVPTHEVRAAMESALRRWGLMQQSAIDRLSKTLNLPEPVKRAIERDLEDARRAFVKEASEALVVKDGSGDGWLFG